MNNELLHVIVAAWATRGLPARLDVANTARLLGFAEHDIQVLMATRKLVPLGDPAPNAPKWFGAMEVIRLSADDEWLNKATKEVSKYWRHKRERRRSSPECRRAGRHNSRSIIEKVSPKPSPDSSPSEQSEGDEGAISKSE